MGQNPRRVFPDYYTKKRLTFIGGVCYNKARRSCMDIIVDFQKQEVDGLIAKRKKRLEKAATWISKRHMETGIPLHTLINSYYNRKKYLRQLPWSFLWLLATGIIAGGASMTDSGIVHFNAFLWSACTLLLGIFKAMPSMAELEPFTQTEKADMDYLLRIINGV